MTDTFDVLAGLDPGDGLRLARWSEDLSTWPKQVVAVHHEGGRVDVELRGPEGGDYRMFQREGSDPHLEYHNSASENGNRGRVVDMAVVPEAFMPDRAGYEPIGVNPKASA